MSSSQTLKSKARVANLNGGIKKDEIGHIVQALSISLSTTYILYLKTQAFHWNVVGPHFYSLHKLAESQYEELGGAIDEMAERIRALGHPAPASFSQFQKLAHIDEFTEILSAEEMLQQLANDHETVAGFLREAFTVAERAYDHATCDMFAKLIAQHEKATWMLRATLD